MIHTTYMVNKEENVRQHSTAHYTDPGEVKITSTAQLICNYLTLPNATVELSTTVKDLSVVLDNQLTMADHITALSRSCFFHIRQLRSIRQSLSTDAMKTLVYACLC